MRMQHELLRKPPTLAEHASGGIPETQARLDTRTTARVPLLVVRRNPHHRTSLPTSTTAAMNNINARYQGDE